MTDAEEIKERRRKFLKTALHLTVAAEKTLITHASNGRARFLGYEIGGMQSKQRRTVNEGIALYIPEDVIQTKRQRYLRDGKVVHRTERMNESEYDRITRYQWEYRGLVAYYGKAQNLAHLGYGGYTMNTSFLKTLAAKNSTSLVKILKRLQATTQTPNGPRKSLKLTIQREGKRPLVATFGGLSLKKKDTVIKDQVIRP